MLSCLERRLRVCILRRVVGSSPNLFCIFITIVDFVLYVCSLSGSIYLVRTGHHMGGIYFLLIYNNTYLYWQCIDLDELQFLILDSPVSFMLTQRQIAQSC